MLGISPSGKPEAAVFWASFWPALYSGALYSIVTGLVVGLAVLMVQKAAESRQARRDYKREISLLRPRLRQGIARPNPFVISSAVSSVPGPAQAAVELLQNLPVSLWKDELPRERAFLDRLLALQRAHSEFHLAATELDHLLSLFVRAQNAEREAIAANDPPLRSFIFGRMNGFASEQLLPWIDVPKAALAWLEPSAAVAAEDSAIREAHGKFVNARRTLEARLEDLRAALDA